MSVALRLFTCSAWKEGPTAHKVPRHRSDCGLLGRLSKPHVSGYSHQAGGAVIETLSDVAQLLATSRLFRDTLSIKNIEEPSDTLG